MNKTKYIVALSASPSKGFNSDSMLDAFIEGVKSASDNKITIEKVYLADLHIAHYDFTRRVPLPEETDLIAIADKIKKANGLVIATPTYNFGVPAGLKNLIDRLGFIALDYKTINKYGQPTGQFGYLKTFSLVTGGSPSWFEKIAFPLFPRFWLRTIYWYFGAQATGSIFGGNMKAPPHDAKNNAPLMAHCRNAGMRFAKGL